ncbi:AraC family transcriptional regulator [Streptomyces subrutilus]|uniref:AraC family transcriptional regulator n=1 Tax=Streptomyces subrutilus TaxID=36818 RepID=A0A5P2UDB7_9ACTN|nr:AraC family transcriptional regulator [Streptomyces subrutilus]QEU77212.1 AraC family transcriptional regulator [Streptomyces subrutilus]GGZ45566.1 AraC family transcriptional regulator [Streptomyces subrutilus]
MPSLEPSTVAASYAHAVWTAVLADGEAGGPRGPGRWASPTERVPFAEVREVWRRALGAGEADPHVGLRVGALLRPAGLHVLGHVVLTSASLADAARAAVRYHPLVSQAGTVGLIRGAERSRLRYRPTVGPDAMHPQQVEAIVTAMVTAARWVAGDGWAPVSVAFAHPRAGSPEPYARVLRCPVVFGAAEHEIVLANADLDRPRVPCDPELNALHRAYADRLLRELTTSVPLRERVRQWLEHAPLDGSGPAEPSKELHLSPRTLRRVLREEGTSWRELLDGARHARVRRLLETTGLPLDRVAGAVGLSGATALVRAFTRWEGVTPGAYRRLRGGSGTAGGPSGTAAGR